MHCCCNWISQKLSTCFGPWRPNFRKSVPEYRHYGVKLCPSIYGIMVNRQCVLCIGWGRYTGIIIKVIVHRTYKSNYKNVEVQQSHNRRGVAQRVPGVLGSISWHSAREGGEVVSLTHRPPLPPRKCSWHSFSLGAESAPGPWCVRKEMCHWKIQWPPGIDPGTVRLVAQRLNHCATPGPQL